MGSLRSLQSLAGLKFRFFGVAVTQDDKVYLEPRHVGVDRIGTYRWTQGDLRFTLDTQLMEGFVHLELAIYNDAEGKYIRYSKDIETTEEDVDFPGVVPEYIREINKSGIGERGIFALRECYLEFPKGWTTEVEIDENIYFTKEDIRVG
jgi:hypothetical protein